MIFIQFNLFLDFPVYKLSKQSQRSYFQLCWKNINRLVLQNYKIGREVTLWQPVSKRLKVHKYSTFNEEKYNSAWLLVLGHSDIQTVSSFSQVCRSARTIANCESVWISLFYLIYKQYPRERNVLNAKEHLINLWRSSQPATSFANPYIRFRYFGYMDKEQKAKLLPKTYARIVNKYGRTDEFVPIFFYNNKFWEGESRLIREIVTLKDHNLMTFSRMGCGSTIYTRNRGILSQVDRLLREKHRCSTGYYCCCIGGYGDTHLGYLYQQWMEEYNRFKFVLNLKFGSWCKTLHDLDTVDEESFKSLYK
jgi:hypothetical protein